MMNLDMDLDEWEERVEDKDKSGQVQVNQRICRLKIRDI